MRRKCRWFVADVLRVSGCAMGMIALRFCAQAQLVNDWTNPVSARWESPSWSLGVLPASTQIVNITNAGYKAVDMDSTTFSAFPDSAIVSNLTVSAPSDSQSTLLLNYAGTAVPFKVLNACSIGANGTLDNFESSFEVDGTHGGGLDLVGGTFVQIGGLTVVNAGVSVLNGSLNTTNGNLTLAGGVTLGSVFEANSSRVNQDGGSIAAQQVDIRTGGRYELVSGVLYAINGTQCNAGGLFVQAGGTNYGDIAAMGTGSYHLQSGMVQGNVMSLGNASFGQDDGLLSMQTISLVGGSCTFSNGFVRCGTLTMHDDSTVTQGGGQFFSTNNFDLHGDSQSEPDGLFIIPSTFVLQGGELDLPSIRLGDYGVFEQDGGSNEISGGLTMTGGTYTMLGGTLETTYTGVGAAANFMQNQGQDFIHGVLSITGSNTLSGGNLVCEGLYLRGALSLSQSNSPTTFTNIGLLDLGGNLSTSLPDAEAGQVRLSTNTIVTFTGSPAVLRFGNSSAVAWTAGALLVIANWRASVHLFAGDDASGLSASQLQQIQFADPVGFAPGNYPAQILSSGEIVPAVVQLPMLTVLRQPKALVLSWPGNYQLLSATNVAGPYLPIPDASSPWTNLFSQPSQFFRLSSF